ncbi:MAG: 4Fe-4S binding protein [Ruminococcaceae bacterium]|nr:4Fe-4S binding protein [Oscillospiraceae bacterium]
MGKKKFDFRLALQGLWAFVTNSYLVGFAQGKIYQGRLKNLCLPGLNCYSCPGALGSCPVGALQSSFSSRGGKISLYVSGFLIFVGAVMGRYVCGWLCPFGLIQELLNKIPFPKKLTTFKGDRLLRKLKYVILLVFVILLPMVAVDVTGLGEPWFCKYICPAGTLEGGVPLVLLNSALRETVGFLYTWKILILALTVLLSVIIYRPFCKYICPLGALYSFFNKISVFRITLDKEKCVGCGKCERACKMNVNPAVKPDSAECIRCRECVSVCPTGALKDSFSCLTDKKKEK